eukprot:16451787-Heterocapsa_arctica.AAC.1
MRNFEYKGQEQCHNEWKYKNKNVMNQSDGGKVHRCSEMKDVDPRKGNLKMDFNMLVEHKMKK